MTQAATKRTETKPTGVSAAAAFFCVLAAACTTVRVTLLLLELTAVVLLLCAGLARLLRPLAGRGTPLALAVFAVALAGAMHMALLAWRPAWWAELHMPLYLSDGLSCRCFCRTGMRLDGAFAPLRLVGTRPAGARRS